MMRRGLICLLFLIPGTCFAQFWIGPKLGIQGYTTTFKFAEGRQNFKNHPKLGFTLGGSISANLKPTFAIVGELQYSLKGKNTENRDNNWRNSSTYHFLEGPIILRYEFEELYYEGITMKPYIEAGPNFSYWMGGRGRIFDKESSGSNYKVVFDESDTLNFTHMSIGGANRFMWALEFGGGVFVDIKQGQRVAIDLRFQLGHTFFGDKDGAKIPILDFSDNLEQHYRLLNLSVAYYYEVDLRKLRKGKSTIKKRKRY